MDSIWYIFLELNEDATSFVKTSAPLRGAQRDAGFWRGSWGVEASGTTMFAVRAEVGR